MRRLAFVALAAALGCDEVSRLDPGPADRFYRPMGVGVHEHALVVASSNADLRYEDGTVIAVDAAADPAMLTGTVNVPSFAGELAIADAAACGLPQSLALVPIRGTNLLYRIPIGAGGALSCDGCELALGSDSAVDPFAVEVACGSGIARAYVGYLRSTLGQAWVTQVDLTKAPTDDGAVQHRAIAAGQARGFAYDAARKRLYVTTTTTGSGDRLFWIELSGGCRIDLAQDEGGCRTGSTDAGVVPTGLELRSVALSTYAPPARAFRRAYLTARVYDAVAAASAGFRVDDADGVLLVADLVDDVDGGMDLRIVREIPIGYGASHVRVLPARTGKRDVVVALAADDAMLWILDDETGALVRIGRDANGVPLVGRGPFGLAVDPVPVAGNVRVYVGSFQESFVTAIDVPLDDPEAIEVVDPPPYRRIDGGTP